MTQPQPTPFRDYRDYMVRKGLRPSPVVEDGPRLIEASRGRALAAIEDAGGRG